MAGPVRHIVLFGGLLSVCVCLLVLRVHLHLSTDLDVVHVEHAVLMNERKIQGSVFINMSVCVAVLTVD